MGRTNSATDVNWRKAVDLVQCGGFSGSGGFDQLSADT
jgi:hypothetical protein